MTIYFEAFITASPYNVHLYRKMGTSARTKANVLVTNTKSQPSNGPRKAQRTHYVRRRCCCKQEIPFNHLANILHRKCSGIYSEILNIARIWSCHF